MRAVSFLAGAGLASVALSASLAHAAAISRLNCKDNPNGVKTISPESTTDVGPGQTDPFAIVRILSAQIRITDPVAGGTQVTKTFLSHPEAFGEGLAGGYTGGGPRNPSGPWVGLHWPYRDFNDGYADPSSTAFPPGNEVGRITTLSPNITLVDGIVGAMAYDLEHPATYLRGFPGNGVTDFTRYFSIDLTFLNQSDRTVLVGLENVSFEVLVRDRTTGQFSLSTQRTPDVTLGVHVPAPGAGAALLLGLAGFRRRR